MSCWNTISFALCSLCISVLSAARDTVPYFCGFERSEESEVQLWHSGTNPFLPDADQLKNLWYAGTAEAVEGNRSLYISADGGVSARYRGVENTVLAYRVFDLPAGTYNLAFDWKTNQFYNNSCLMVAWIDDSDRRVISTTGSDIPDVILDNHLTVSDKYGNTSDTLQAGSAWERVCATITSDGVTKKKLVFAWHNPTGADGLPGGCIDNIDIAYAACACPADIVIKKRPDGIDVSWTGTAPQYDICYKRHSDTIWTTAQTAGTSFAIQQLDAGIYDIKVRSVYPDCGKSVWSECFNIFLLGATARCLDYTDLNAEGVKCYWGVFDNPRQHNQVVDFGPRSQKSFHTIHYDLNEYDEITKRQLKTVPEGMLASVRLSSWQEGVGVAKAPSAAVEYPLTVTDDAKVLLLYYAAVFEHCENPEGMWKPTPAQQPYINVRILDEDGNLLTECTKARFSAAELDQGNKRGWEKFKWDATYHSMLKLHVPIIWFDWKTLGINLTDFVGQKVKVSISLHPCAWNLHMGYGYFALQCTHGEVEGWSCGEKPNRFEVPDGFDYRWYLASDPNKNCKSDSAVLVPLPNDTCTYCCDLMYKEDNGCYFTLKAYTLPRLPRSDATVAAVAENCTNRIVIDNRSAVYVTSPVTGRDSIVVDTITSYRWECGELGNFYTAEPEIPVPDEGGTYTLTLHTEFNGCFADPKQFTVTVPPIGETQGSDTAYLCSGDTITFLGKRYCKTGCYADTLKSVASGCDSVLTLTVVAIEPDSIMVDTTICEGSVARYNGKSYTRPGVYADTIRSVMGCDSVYITLNLAVDPQIILDLPAELSVCAGDTGLIIPIDITSGTPDSICLIFAPDAIDSGFVSSRMYMSDNAITLSVPKVLTPDVYHATIKAFGKCGGMEMPVSLTVNYPDSIVEQKWNDVFAVLNNRYNGGYRFTAFQWMKNGIPLPGENRPYLYVPDLDTAAQYQVSLVRQSDGVELPTCPVTYTPRTEKNLFVSLNPVLPARVACSEAMPIALPQGAARVAVYTLTGAMVGSWAVDNGAAVVQAPSVPGIYIVAITTAHNVVTGKLRVY